MLLGEISSSIVVFFMLILGIRLTKLYLDKRKTYVFWWAVSFWLAFIAAITDLTSYFMGWSLFQYRLYLFSAASLVAYMGAGTVFLFSKTVGRIYVALMTIAAVAMGYSLANTSVDSIANIPAGEQAQGFVPDGISIYFAILSGIGALALFVGALYSWYRSKKSYNLWIAAGALIFSIGGAVGKYLGVYQLFYIFQAIGSIGLYHGIVSSLPGQKVNSRLYIRRQRNL